MSLEPKQAKECSDAGHTVAIIDAASSDARTVCLTCDPEALTRK